MKKPYEEILITFVGDAGIGKTCTIQSFLNSTFIPMYYPTTCNKFECMYQLNNGPNIKLTIWDTSGLSEYDSSRPLCYANADLFVICFSKIEPKSITNAIEKWFPEIQANKPGKPILFLGTKCDLDPNKFSGIPLEFLPLLKGYRHCYYAESSSSPEYISLLRGNIENPIKEILNWRRHREEANKIACKCQNKTYSCKCNLL